MDTFQHVCEVRAGRDFIVCSQLRIIDAQPPQGNTGHQDELQARGGRPTHFLTACVSVCVRVCLCVRVCERGDHGCAGAISGRCVTWGVVVVAVGWILRDGV